MCTSRTVYIYCIHKAGSDTPIYTHMGFHPRVEAGLHLLADGVNARLALALLELLQAQVRALRRQAQLAVLRVQVQLPLPFAVLAPRPLPGPGPGVALTVLGVEERQQLGGPAHVISKEVEALQPQRPHAWQARRAAPEHARPRRVAARVAGTGARRRRHYDSYW